MYTAPCSSEGVKIILKLSWNYPDSDDSCVFRTPRAPRATNNHGSTVQDCQSESPDTLKTQNHCLCPSVLSHFCSGKHPRTRSVLANIRERGACASP